MTSMNFLLPEISQTDLVTFSDDHVNLKREYAQRYRDQVKRLREHLDRYISEHPDIGLEKMMLSGSLAKGTALSTIQDVDVALYVKGDAAPGDLSKLLGWLAERLRATYSTIDPQNITVEGPCVIIAFSGTEINVEITPILHLGDSADRGYLWDRSSGKKVLTSIPQHREFIQKRKDAQPDHFAQVVRLLKWWAQVRTLEAPDFHFRSFLIELLMAKLADSGQKFDDYHAGLEAFFTFIQNTGLRQRIAFTDNYPLSRLPKLSTGVVEIFDPINPENNVAEDWSESDRKKLMGMADQALDTLSYARACQTKGAALECWQELMGGSFNA
jgi:hypothetical protein